MTIRATSGHRSPPSLNGGKGSRIGSGLSFARIALGVRMRSENG
jgi:hypothetical protein